MGRAGGRVQRHGVERWRGLEEGAGAWSERAGGDGGRGARAWSERDGEGWGRVQGHGVREVGGPGECNIRSTVLWVRHLLGEPYLHAIEMGHTATKK